MFKPSLICKFLLIVTFFADVSIITISTAPSDLCPSDEQIDLNPMEATSKCPPNQVYKLVGTRCEATCALPKPGSCPSIRGPKGCYCIPPYLRNNNGACLKLSDCPKCLKKNEQYNKCDCEKTCLVKSPNCTITNCTKGCFCAKNFVRDSNGNCISSKNCHK